MSTVYELTQTDLQRLVNHAYGAVIDGLRQEDFLTRDQADRLALHYSVIVESDSWLPKYLAKWVGSKPSAVQFRLVKVLGRQEKQG